MRHMPAVVSGVVAVAALAAACSPPPAAPPSSTQITTTAVPPPAPKPFVLEVTPDKLWIGVGRQSGNLDGIVVPNKGFWRMEVRATGATFGSIKRIEQTLRDRHGRLVLGSTNASGPFLGYGNTPNRVYDPLKTYGRQSFDYSLDLGFDGRPADLHTTVIVEDVTGELWTLEHTMPWELLAAPTPTYPVNVKVRQNDPASGCGFDPVHGYGLVVDLAWNPPPAGVPVSNYSLSVFDGRGRDLIQAYYFPTETKFRLPRCGMHVGADAERGARFGIRTHHAPSYGMSAFNVATFDFQSCREAGVPACQ